METKITILEKPKLRKPILVEGLPGIGNVGRIAAGYLVNELKMKKFAELYTPHFLPLVIMHNDATVSVLKCEFFYYHGKSRDIVVLTGDTQSVSSEGHYEFCEAVLNFSEKLGIKEIITIGGFGEERVVDEPKVIGAVSDVSLIKKYKKYDINFGKEHQVGTIVGASGLLIGMGRARGMEGLCLMGETFGLPITDPKAADRVLKTLGKILGLKLNLSSLEKTIKDMEEHMKKTEKIHKRIIEDLPKGKGEELRYIG